MTVESCISFCDERLFVYAGVEYGQECCMWTWRDPLQRALANYVIYLTQIVIITLGVRGPLRLPPNVVWPVQATRRSTVVLDM
jgi:hypothetical protein